MLIMSNLIIINNSYRGQDLYLQSQNLTCLHLFQIGLNCKMFRFNKEISRDCDIKISFFHFSN